MQTITLARLGPESDEYFSEVLRVVLGEHVDLELPRGREAQPARAGLDPFEALARY